MRQQVNLYQPIFRKQEKKFSATVVLLQAPALILGVIAIFFAWTQWQVRQLNGELVRVDQQQAAAQKRLNDVTQQFGGRAQVSQTADEEIAKLQQRLAERQRMRELLGKGLFSNTNGFFEYLAAIGRQTPPGMGLWLTGFDIVGAGEQVTLQGRALNAEAVPRFVQKLAHEPRLAGIEFKAGVVERPAAEKGSGSFEFTLKTAGAVTPRVGR